MTFDLLEDIAVVVADIVDFTGTSSQLPPAGIVTMLNTVFGMLATYTNYF